ncbi:MAG: hypothetical protein PVG45_07950 [Gammaproteobacteria bacterium]|jgi:hypothetical protein
MEDLINAKDGIYGLILSFDPGAYWFVFDSANEVTGTLQTPGGAPSPLAEYAMPSECNSWH